MFELITCYCNQTELLLECYILFQQVTPPALRHTVPYAGERQPIQHVGMANMPPRQGPSPGTEHPHSRAGQSIGQPPPLINIKPTMGMSGSQKGDGPLKDGKPMGSITQGTPVNQPGRLEGGSISMGTPRYADTMARNPNSPHQGKMICKLLYILIYAQYN